MTVAWIAIAAVGLLLVGNGLLGFIATRPRLQARLFGQNNKVGRFPDALGLAYERVDYGEGLWGWWIPAMRSKATVVLVHGFGLSTEPITVAPEPLLEFAAALHDLGYSSLAINLGYATRSHPYTGGRSEANDIIQACDWLETTRRTPIAVWGFSAGGHDALVAAAKDSRILGVAVDSAFTHTGKVVQQQAVRMLHGPRWLFLPLPAFFRIFGGRDVDIAAVWASAPAKPVLIVHGASDEAIAPSEAHRLQAIMSGDLWVVPAAGHVDAYRVATAEYVERAKTFLGSLSGGA